MSGNRRRAKLTDIARIAEALREPVETPDFTSSILERVHAEKPFLAPETRRWLPVVRIGIAGLAVMCVFAMTLIIFVKPSLPEQLGAPASVTTEFFSCAEDGVTTKIADLRKGMDVLRYAADTRRLVQGADLTAAPGTVIAADILVQDVLVQDAAADLAEPAPRPPDLTLVALTLPAPVPVTVAVPSAALTPRTSFQYADYTTFVGSADARFARDDTFRGSLPWQRAAMLSNRGPDISPVSFSGTAPTLNQKSPTLVKELLNLISGQPASDELQIR